MNAPINTVVHSNWEINKDISATNITDPIISMLIKPKDINDFPKFVDAVAELCSKDDLLKYRCNNFNTAQHVVIMGMGELHLEIFCHKIEKEYNIPIMVGTPRPVYYQTRDGTLEEPIMILTVKFDTKVVDNNFSNSLENDIKRRMGKDIRFNQIRDSLVEMTAVVPLSEILGYSKYIKELSGGTASYVLYPCDYEFMGAMLTNA